MTDEPLLGALDPDAPTPFGRHSLLRRVLSEPVVALMTQRVLVMDVAHPKVAAGVEDHSAFRHRPWRRAWVTVDAALRLVFGPTATARGAARQIYATHDRIHGTLGQAAGDWGADEAYDAHDATLLLWVWATLVDSAAVAYERFVAPFDAAEAERYYADMVSFARFVGIPAPLLPADRAAFAVYLESMLTGGLLGSTAAGHDLARHILWFSHRRVPAPVVRIGRLLALTTLDPRLSAALDLRLDHVDAARARRLDDALRRHYRHLPRGRAALPTAYVVLRTPTVGLAARLRSGRVRL